MTNERGIVERLRDLGLHTPDQAADLIEAAYRWLDRFARHVGCLGADKCECGLTPLMIQMDKALATSKDREEP